jgi:hypothetical protein
MAPRRSGRNQAGAEKDPRLQPVIADAVLLSETELAEAIALAEEDALRGRDHEGPVAADDPMTVTKLERWLQLLTAERDRRRGTDGDALERFLDQLAEMGARLRVGLGCIELTPAEHQKARRLVPRKAGPRLTTTGSAERQRGCGSRDRAEEALFPAHYVKRILLRSPPG